MKNIKKFIALGLVATFATGLFAGCGSSSDNGSAREIVVAVAPGFYPITYADDNGAAAGYDVEVFKEVDKLLDDYTFATCVHVTILF